MIPYRQIIFIINSPHHRSCRYTSTRHRNPGSNSRLEQTSSTDKHASPPRLLGSKGFKRRGLNRGRRKRNLYSYFSYSPLEGYKERARERERGAHVCERVVSIHGFSAWRGVEGEEWSLVSAVRALRCRCRRRRRVFTRRLSHQNCAHTRCNTRVTGIKGISGGEWAGEKKSVVRGWSIYERYEYLEIFGGAEKKKSKEKSRWRNFWNGLKGKKSREVGGGKSCGRGGGCSRSTWWRFSLEKISLELDDCPIHGFLKLCFVQFCCTWEEGCCSRFEKVFSTLKAGGEGGERKIQSI